MLRIVLVYFVSLALSIDHSDPLRLKLLKLNKMISETAMCKTLQIA